MSKAVTGIMLTLLFIGMLTLAFQVQKTKASGTIYIRADGSIDPPDAPISTFDNVTYTLTGNITSDTDGIVIERSGVTVNGNGYALQGSGYGSGYGFYLGGINNVRITGVNIRDFNTCVYMSSGSNNTISGNNISSKIGRAVDLYDSSNNTVSGNNITNNFLGLYLNSSPNNTVIGNTITNNTYHGVNLIASPYNSFSGNNIKDNGYGDPYFPGYGIMLDLGSSYNSFRHNSMIGNLYNFGVSGGTLSDYSQDVDTSNTVDGKPIYYWFNRHNEEVPSDAGYVALINSTNITAKELELKNSGQGILLVYTTNSQIANNSITNNDLGVHLVSSNNNTISSDNITNNSVGITLSSSSNNTIRENNITNNVPIDREGGGLLLDSSSYNVVSGNNITNNNYWGIIAQMSSFNGIYGNNLLDNSYGVTLGWSSNYNAISRNTISNSTWGINLYGTYGLHSNAISENLVTKNDYGIYTNAEDNKIYHNNFINNTQQVDDWSWYYPGYPMVNVWDDAYPSCGNYWSDYSGVDVKSGPNQDQHGSDGIGDEPYVINTYNYDRYPLMSPWPSGPGLHELEVTLKAPTRLPPGNSTLLQATVSNKGSFGEENVTLFLYLDDNIVNSTTVSLLESGSSYTINHTWTPTAEGLANVTAYATPVQGEILVENNRKTAFVTVSINPPVQNLNTGLYYETIQEAIDAPETLDGHRIKVKAGMYYEHVTISKSLKITGEDRTYTIIDGSKTGSFVVQINANNVVLSGFTIQNSNVAPTPAISISSSNNVISNNTIVNNGWGIYAFSVSNNTIENNIITNNVYGISLEWVTTHTVRNNTITNHEEAGIYLSDSRNNIFADNIIQNNKDGIVLVSDSNYDKIYHNDFIDNTSPGFTVNSDTNTWDNGYPSGGNYWSNYAGVDVKSGPNQDQPGSDGIGDTPFTFSGSNQDKYPLMNPIGSPQPPIAIFTYTPEHPLKDKTVTFNATASDDRDGFIISNKWDFGDGNITTTTDSIITHIYAATGTYQVNLTITDNDGLSHSTTTLVIVVADSTPPITVHDYDSLWHTSDFTITLTAVDDWSGVAETYYRINDGPTKTVSIDGQPRIETEGANNKLEYWSVDNAGNEELPHKTLTGIRLDKTVPSMGVPSRDPAGDVQPDQSVKISLNVTDALSQAKNVTLYYTTDNGNMWTDLPMNNTALNLYEATIPQQQAGIWVRFRIVAYDHAGNNATLEGTQPYLVYQVLPEFPSFLILLFFFIATLLAVIVYRRKHQTL